MDWRGLHFEVELLDIQQLNDRWRQGEFDVAKTSFYAALSQADQLYVLPTGSALGFGVGPLLLAAEAGTVPEGKHQRTLCPGDQTTATLLFRLFYPEATVVEHVVFSEIMPRLQQGTADFGVCIHEGRFTWESSGLSLVEDLGTRWERVTGQPLPLGGLVASRQLGTDTVQTVQAVIADSLQHALRDRSAPLKLMRAHAQEFSDDVLYQHVDLYVNEWTQDLGSVGREALRALSSRARKVGLAAGDLQVFEA